MTATEVQAVADASANAGAVALTKSRSADTEARGVAGANSVDGHAFLSQAADQLRVTLGRWDGSSFTETTPYNAVRADASATVTNLVVAAMLDPGATVTSVNKTAIAAFMTIGQARPGLPLVIGQCGECYNNSCAYTYNLYFASQNPSTDTAAWLQIGDGGAAAIKAVLPTSCGGGGQPNAQYLAGSTVITNNGGLNSVCQIMNCLWQSGQDEFLVPVIAQCGGPYPNASRQIIGFATIKIVYVQCQTSSKYITVQRLFVDCRPGDVGTPCEFASYGGTCPGCGTGSVSMVQ